MRWLLAPSLRPFLVTAGAASLVLNLMLLIPAVFALQVFERVFSSRSLETLVMLTLLVLLSLLLAYFMDVLRAKSLERCGAELARRLAPAALREEIEQRGAPKGRRATDSLRDVSSLRAFVGGGGAAMFDAPWLLLHLLAITLMDAVLGAAATAGALVLMLLAYLTDKATRAGSEALQQKARALHRQSQSLQSRAEVLVGMGMAQRAVASWAQAHSAILEDQTRLSNQTHPLAAAARVLQHLVQAGVLALGAWLVISRHASPGIMVGASLLLGRALQPATQLIGSWNKLVLARSAWHRLGEQSTLSRPVSTVELPPPNGALEVERLVFGAGAQRAPLLNGISFRLPAGSSLGLVGASGSGKSSLARLMLGLWLPQSGVVRLDGADIHTWDRHQLSPFIGYLPQDIELFPGTVAENIARLGATGGAAVVEAAQLAGAHDMILRLPQGYDTLVGEGGATLSGGQRQRVALARALFGDPRLVVLDEPNAHLDVDGDRALAGAIKRLKSRGTTVVVISHRSAILASLDQIAVLDGGQIRLAPTRAEAPARASGADVIDLGAHHVPSSAEAACQA